MSRSNDVERRYVFFSIADDGYALRHVEIFANVIALRYDWFNWTDEVDSLAAARYDQTRWLEAWGPDHASDAEEFTTARLTAADVPNQPQGYLDHGPWAILHRIARQ